MNPVSLKSYRSCRLCPWECGVDRAAGELGRCEAPATVKIADYMPHFGEEACLVGDTGSGAVFFSHCTLRCLFCQTWEMSWKGEGTEVDLERLSDCFLWLEAEGCVNLNLITPTHYLPHILQALERARTAGFSLPVVYNTSSFERVEVLKAVQGVVDIYLADFKFWEPETAKKLCGSPDYPETVRRALVEMHRQVGDLQTDGCGLARRGVLLRHLVLPGYLGETFAILDWVAETLSTETYLNLMGHFRPCHLARTVPTLARTLTRSEYEAAKRYAQAKGLHRIDTTHERLYEMLWSPEPSGEG